MTVANTATTAAHHCSLVHFKTTLGLPEMPIMHKDLLLSNKKIVSDACLRESAKKIQQVDQIVAFPENS